MDFQSAMETFAEAWVAANTGKLAPGLVSSLNGGGETNSIFLGAKIDSTSVTGGGSASAPLQQLGTKGGLFANPTPTPKSINNNHHSQLGLGSGRSPQDGTAPSIPQAHNILHHHQQHSEYKSNTHQYSSSCASPSGIDLSPTRRLKSLHQQHQQQRKISQGSSALNPTQSPKDLLMTMDHGAGTHAGNNSNAGKSMPIHCVIEVSRDLGKEDHQGTTLGCRSSSPLGSGGDTISVIKDSFVIIPVGTPFQDVVTTVLSLLGYPEDIIRQAEGTISLRNWKPLRLDQVCDSPHKTVGDILNDLTNYATLRVLVTRAKDGTTDDLKEKLLRLLLAQSSTLLLGAGCPLDEVTLTQLVKGHWPQNLAEDVKRRFDDWYSAQHHQTVTGLVESLQKHHSHLGGFPPQLQSSGGPCTPSASCHNSSTAASNGNGNEMTTATILSPGRSPGDGNGGHLLNGLSSSGMNSSSSSTHLQSNTIGHHHHSSLDPHHHRHQDLLNHHQHPNKSTGFMDDGLLSEVNHHNHPVFHGLSAQKTRMRTSFDPEMELPKLQQWFADNPHPSRHQIQQYVRELNLLDCRKDRKPLDVNNVIYWFKNARAAQKRNELRYNGIPGHHQPFGTSHLSHQQQLQLHAQYSQSSQLSLQSSRGRSSSPGRDTALDSRRSSRNENENDNSTSTCNSDQEGHDEYLPSNNDLEHTPEKKSLAVTTPECLQSTSVVIKEEFDDDFISVEDVSLSGGEKNGHNEDLTLTRTASMEEPKDLSGKSPMETDDGDNNNKLSADLITEDAIATKDEGRRVTEEEEDRERENDQESSSTSLSPRSSPGLSPNHHFDFGGPPSMVSRFHPFFDHPSFMAYRQFNSFNFGQNFPDSSGGSNLDTSPGGNNNSTSPAAAAAAAMAYEVALNRKHLGLPMGKLAHGGGPLDIFHDFPHGLIPSHRAALGHHESLARLRGDEMFSPRSASSADLISSFINSNRGDVSLSSLALGGSPSAQNSLALDERRKRNRTFIDPVTEVPRLEQWFGLNTHPSHNLILKYTDELNRMPYRQKFPRLEPKNVQFWMKNRRAKVKRMKNN